MGEGRRGWGEGGAAGVPSAQAPRGAAGEGPGSVCRSCHRLFIVCVAAGAAFPGEVWATWSGRQ